MKRNEKKWSETTGGCSKGTSDGIGEGYDGFIECAGLIDKDSICEKDTI